MYEAPQRLQKIWDFTPHSKATNSYDLLAEVDRVILAEPKRVYMQTFYNVTVPPNDNNINRGPVCGTIGCIAGWMDTLTCPSADVLVKLDFNADDRSYLKLPEVCRNDAYNLFYGSNESSSNYPFPDDSLYGTVEYAQAVSANIRKFMRRWESELRAFQLTPPAVAG